MKRNFKFFFTRIYTILSIVLFVLTYTALKVSAVYYPTDNITNPTCAPGDSGCYVSLLPDQTSKAGSLLFSDGTNPSWANPAGMTWDSAENTLLVKRVLRLGNNSVTPNGYGSALYISGNPDYSTPNFTYEPFITAQPYGVQFVVRVQRANGTPAAPTAVLAGQVQYAIQTSPYGTSGYTTSVNSYLITSLENATTGNSPAIRHGFITSQYGSDAGLFAYPQGVLIGNSAITYTTTPTARLQVNGSGSSSSTYTAQFHNSTGTNNSLTIRDDGNIGVGTSTPLSRFHINKASTVNSSPAYAFEPLLRLSEDQSNSAAEIAMESSNGQGGLLFSRSLSSGGIPLNSGVFRIRISGSTGIGTHSSLYQIFSVGASENWTPTANGIRFLFSPVVNGTTNASGMLSINGDGVTVGGDSTSQSTNRLIVIGRGNTSSTNSLTIRNNLSQNIFNIRDDGYMLAGIAGLSGIVARFQNSTGTCDINPTTTSLSCSSDRTLKTNITNLNNTILNQITSLQPVTYTWINDNTNQQQTGFIAQDVEQIFPSLVSTDPTTNLKSLNYIGLIPYAIEGIKELDVKVNQQALLFNNDQTRLDKIRVFFNNLFGENKMCIDDETCLTKQDVRILLEIVKTHQTAPTTEPVIENIPNSENNIIDENSENFVEQEVVQEESNSTE